MIEKKSLVPDNDAVACRLPYHSSTEESLIDTRASPLHQNESHPLFPKLQLLARSFSGKQWEIETFRRKL